MSDRDLNLAIHTEAEGWQWVGKPGHYLCWERPDEYFRNGGYGAQISSSIAVPDYCHDTAWCMAMMEKHKFKCYPSKPCVYPDESWHIEYRPGCQMVDKSLTRAVALAVLQLTREGKSNA